MKRNSFLKSLATLLIAPSVVKDIQWDKSPNECTGSYYDEQLRQFHLAKLKKVIYSPPSGRYIDIEELRSRGEIEKYFNQPVTFLQKEILFEKNIGTEIKFRL